jgi:hypothetical protein
MWLMAQAQIPKPVAKATFARARGLRHLPFTEAAWLAGDISVSHVRALLDARRPSTEDQMAKDEEMLVGQAKELQFRHFAKAVAYWEQLADDDASDERARYQREDRYVHLSQGFRGGWVLDGEMDDIGGGVVAGEVSRLEAELFKADWAEAKLRLDRDPDAWELARTPRQRRADALVDMAIRSASTAPDAQRPEPLFTVVVDRETFCGRICELANGTVVAPGSLVPWLSRAWVERVLFNAKSRKIDVSVAQRLFKGATRRAIEVRDGECYHPSCDVAGPDCQADHIIPYAAGGPTTQENGRLACGFHNRERHKPPPIPPPDDNSG